MTAQTELEKYFHSPEYQTRERRRLELAHELSEQRGMSFITAVVAAGDMLSAEDATEKVKKKELTPLQALKQVGSYAKFDWAVKHLPKKQLFKRLPYIWMTADPDDTNPDYLALWKNAFRANGNKPILYTEPLPEGKYITVYRGQIGKKNPGFAWTTSWKTAQQFALSGGGRSTVKGGVILTGKVPRYKVLAYITERGEHELIVDPKNVKLGASYKVEEVIVCD